MPQTKFVLRKAFACHIRPIVVINKIDRPDARPTEVLNEIFDTFVEQGASEDQLDFPYIYASGKAGFASHDPHATSGDIKPLFEMIIEPRARARSSTPTAPSACSAPRSTFRNTSAGSRSGGSSSGRVKRGQKAVLMKAANKNVAGSIDSVMVFDKLGRTEVEEAEAGDIVAIVGLGSVDIGDTIADPENPSPCRASRSMSRP